MRSIIVVVIIVMLVCVVVEWLDDPLPDVSLALLISFASTYKVQLLLSNYDQRHRYTKYYNDIISN